MFVVFIRKKYKILSKYYEKNYMDNKQWIKDYIIHY